METDSATKELQEAFLSLILVIFDKLITAHDFDDAVLERAIGHMAMAMADLWRSSWPWWKETARQRRRLSVSEF